MKKHLFLKSLLIAFGLLIMSVTQMWGQSFGAENQRQAQMQSQMMMSSGSSYTGTVYEPFSNSTPSEQSYTPAKAPGGGRKAGWYDENGDYHTDEGEFYTGGEDKPSSQSPIGEPWVMVLFALGFAGVIAIRQYKRKTDKSTNMKNSAGKFVATLALLCTLGVGQMWAERWVSSCNIQYYTHNGIEQTHDGWYNEGDGINIASNDVTLEFGTLTQFYFKKAWAKGSHSDNWGCNGNQMKYGFEGNESEYNLNYGNNKDNPRYYEFPISQYDVISNAPNNPGQNTMRIYFNLNYNADGSRQSKWLYINFTIPGFRDLSTTSVTFDNTAVGGNNSKSITYTHYGTAPTNVADRYSITGTNADQFSITALSGTGATIQFTPTSAGTKTATLVINDVHGKQTSAITLTGKTKVLVTYSKGSASGATGSDVTDDKVYGVDLMLKDKGAFTRSGYHQTAWNTNSAGSGGTSYSLGGSYTAEAAVTLYPTWTANTWYVKFNGNGSDDGSMDNESFTYDAAVKALTSNAFTKTGYSFEEWNTEAEGGGTTYTDGQNVRNLTSTKDGIVNLYAQWTANSYTITLDGDEPNKDNAGTRAISGSATYDASMPAQTGTLPTAANGYHFMGFYSLQNGDGVKVIDEDGNWVASADGYTDASTHWVHADDATLYAYFKKAEVTEIAFTEALVEANTTAEAEITVSPSPEGTTMICFKLLYNSGAELADQPSFTYNGSTHKVTFAAPETPGSYKLQVTLRTGSSCDGGTMLDTEDESFTVAGPNVVTIKYMYGDTKTEVKASTTVEGNPLSWTEVSVGTASDDPIGYTFSTWELGDGMTLKDGDALTSRTIHFKSTYNATLKAKYNKKNLIYFYNTLGWEDVYVYFYTSDGYWSADYGTGAYKGKKFDSKSPFWDMHYGQMTQIEGTNIWYFDYTARGWDGWRYIAFANMDKANSDEGDTGNNDLGYFANTTADPIQVVRRGDHYTALPMYVPYNSESSAQLKNDNKAKYFFQGFWMNYPESTGLAIRIYDSKKGDGIHGSYIREVPFELPVDKAIPMSFKTDLEGNKTYGFKLVRHGSSDEWFSNGGTMSNGHSGVGGDLWDFKSEQTSDCGLTTSSAGEYEFSLSFGLDATSKYNFLVGVKYPEATGDYRVMYKDDETESGEWFVSHVIPRLLNKDTVSFFVRPNAHPKMKMQKCTASWDGSSTTVTWTDTISEATNMLSSIPAAITSGGDGVYYFCMNKGEDGKRVMGDVAPYEGEYYIRTDAAPSQWDNYRNSDHKMTYSEYAEEHNTAPAYTHYYMKYANIGTNVKFVVANDYSPYISDTLKGGDHVNMSSHTLNANANIRFMWDRRNNNVGREFIAPAQNNGSRFLVMQGEAEKLLAPNGTALDGYDEAHPGNNKGGGLNAIQFTDKQDWIYTADVKAVPGGRIKLYKSYDGGTHYIYGDNDASFADTHAIELIGGTGDASAQTIRVIYDFKTNRLMTAWIPADTIKTALTLNADIMIVREHQEAASNIVLNGSGKIDLATGKMIYGVMRFNRYTLNNREKTGVHGFLPIANWKSQYERSLYYISFPFDVKINEIFGMGEYGKQWIMQRYRGDQRAQKGFWIDSGSYWKFMGPDMTLNANEGYILTLDLSKFEYDLTGEGEIWHNGVEEIELYFPASEAVNITQVADFELPALDSTIYKCTINRGDGTDGDRRIKDSYWRCIGVPSFADYSGVVKDSDELIITWKTDGLPFLYDINWADKSITAYSGTNFPFKAMHAYLIQNGSNIHWYNVYTYQPSPIVGVPRRSKEELSELEFRLEINQQDSMIDQTYVRLSEADGVTNEFDFGQDMSKEFNAGANIYTFIGYEQVAGNSMPFSDQTTIVPVGVKIASDGEYTFAMPEGTEGVGVVLIDNTAGTRTNLALENYTVNLAEGQYNERFILEISPMAQTPTGIENANDGQNGNIRKMVVDGILYIVKDGKVFDARGNRIQ